MSKMMSSKSIINEEQTQCEDWLEKEIWPQIYNMMTKDSYFKLIAKAVEITSSQNNQSIHLNGGVTQLIVEGYLADQLMTIRRLCDDTKRVISLRKLLQQLKKKETHNKKR